MKKLLSLALAAAVLPFAGAQAAEFLIDRIENPRTAGSETATIPVKLLEGESMGICPVKADAANS